MSAELPEHVRRNREEWDRAAPDWVGRHPDDALEWAQKWPCEEVWKVRRR